MRQENNRVPFLINTQHTAKQLGEMNKQRVSAIKAQPGYDDDPDATQETQIVDPIGFTAVERAQINKVRIAQIKESPEYRNSRDETEEVDCVPQEAPITNVVPTIQSSRPLKESGPFNFFNVFTQKIFRGE